MIDEERVVAAECPGFEDCQITKEEDWKLTGTWDILYRESLLVELDNGLRYVANLQYQIKPTSQQKKNNL